MNRKIARICLFAAALTGFATLPALADESIPTEAGVMNQVENGLTAEEQNAIAEDEAADASAAVRRNIFVCHVRNANGVLYRGVGLTMLRAGIRGLVKCRGVSSLELRPTCKVRGCRRFIY